MSETAVSIEHIVHKTYPEAGKVVIDAIGSYSQGVMGIIMGLAMVAKENGWETGEQVREYTGKSIDDWTLQDREDLWDEKLRKLM